MKRFLWIGALLVTLAGILLTGYLTQAYIAGSIGRICAGGQGCGTVLRSPWSQFAGLPTALYGFGYYLVSFLLFLVYPLFDRETKPAILNGLLGLHLTAFAVSIGLTAYALFGLGTTCFFCNTSLGLVTLLAGGTAFWKIRSARSQTTTTFHEDTWQTATVILFFSTVVASGIAFTQPGTAPVTQSERTQRELRALVQDARSIGDPDAPIRVVEFFDLSCPHCQRFTLNTFPKIKKNYIDTGKVVWTFRFFPITRAHPHTLYAHGALSLVPSHKFLPAKKTIMRQASRWNARHNDDPRNYFGLFLSQYGLTEGPSRGLLREIRRRTRDYAALGIRQTPSFLVNGKIYRGGLPYHRWQSIFDELLRTGK